MSTKQIRVAQMTPAEREIVRRLSPDERKAVLIAAARRKMAYILESVGVVEAETKREEI